MAKKPFSEGYVIVSSSKGRNDQGRRKWRGGCLQTQNPRPRLEPPRRGGTWPSYPVYADPSSQAPTPESGETSYKMGRFAWRLRGCLLGSGPGSRTGYPGLHGHQHLNPSRSGCGKEDEGAVNRLDSALWDSSRLPIIPLASGSAAPMISPPKATWDVTPPLVVGPLPPPRHWRLPGGHSSCLSPFPSEPLDGAVGPRGWDSS